MEERACPKMQADNPFAREIEAFESLSARERTRMKYDDGLTEEQWFEAVDNDGERKVDELDRS